MLQLLWNLLYPQTYKLIPEAKKYDFIRHSRALEDRYQRQKHNWKSHLDHCQKTYDLFFSENPQAQSLCIIGSAHLHEYPKEKLLERFKKIILIDALHPPQIVAWAKKNKQVELIVTDIGQVLNQLDNIFTYEDLLAATQKNIKLSLNADLFISANIMSQLHLTPMSIVENHNKITFSVEQKDALAVASSKNHLAWLKSLKKPVLLYTDRKVLYRNPKGETTYSGSYPVSFSNYEKLDSWNWQLAPLNEISPLYSLEMEVEAYKI